MIYFRRIRQVWKYGWQSAKKIEATLFRRINVFADILYCFCKYKMWSNQYVQYKMNEISQEERQRIGMQCHKEGVKRDLWQNDFRQNRKFMVKYSGMEYEIGRKREIRNRQYAQRYNAGKNLMVEYGVNISRQHYLNGSIFIGNNVLLAKNVFIDYSGDVVIKDDVQLTNGAVIETHHHQFHSDYTSSRKDVVPTKLLIEQGAVIGTRAIVLSSCHYIGKHARVGAGAVVTKDVPDYAVVVGVPAKVVRMQHALEQ